jgi:hypothetical protein
MEYFRFPWHHIFGDKDGGAPTMASHRLADILKSRNDLSDTEIKRMNEDEAWQWIRANASTGELTDETPEYPWASQSTS